ncbi:Uncharacterized protein OBRU01_00513 [Operophtera brumata]|uniref:KAT8 regulatory NSL complex subunit 2 n=1 Tax=Operophtera brumata TaxID=104452 RepID=A0A0L7LV75_OPEBR|nr:Uncharacterized protein OBRU01_00513 [Operophtera brumata]
MFSFTSENISNQLSGHNIRITELKKSSLDMSHPQHQMLHLPKVRMLSRGGRATPSGLRITNKEIANRSRACAHAGYECWSTVLAGRQYCAAHILQDSTAPYVQCAHSFANGERCPAPAPANSDQRDSPLCFEHARAALLSRQRAAAPPPPVISTETLLNQLQHYVNDSEGESVTLGPGGTCRYTLASSDTEDAPIEDSPLWRAGVFTAEEAVSETKTALCALQSAYLHQMDRLKHLLQTARLQYLRSLKQEKEQYSLCALQSAYLHQMDRLKHLLQTARLQYLRSLKQEKEQYCKYF